MKIGIVGHGAMAGALRGVLAQEGAALGAVLVRPGGVERVRAALPADVTVAETLGDFLASGVTVVAECAGHGALQSHGPGILAAGRDLVVAAVGALADPWLETRLRAAAAGGGRLVIPAGAVGGLDALAAARRAGLSSVSYVSRKPPAAWLGTTAERVADLSALTAAAAVFTGTAREAALAFPQNANVVAALALAGLGFDETQVTLMADPAVTGNHHTIEAEGAFGRMSVTMEGRPLPDNPKTSMLAPYSLARAVLNLDARVVV